MSYLNITVLPPEDTVSSGGTMPRGGALAGGYTHLRQLTLVFYLATFIVGKSKRKFTSLFSIICKLLCFIYTAYCY